LGGAALGGRPPGLAHKSLEAREVDTARLNPQPIPARLRREQRPGTVVERTTELRHVTLQRGPGRPGSPGSPQLIDQPFGPYRAAGVEQQQSHQHPQSSGPECDDIVLPPNLERAEQAELQFRH
jgi:hypothetical protein